jgi:hypothetical protein
MNTSATPQLLPVFQRDVLDRIASAKGSHERAHNPGAQTFSLGTFFAPLGGGRRGRSRRIDFGLDGNRVQPMRIWYASVGMTIAFN